MILGLKLGLGLGSELGLGLHLGSGSGFSFRTRVSYPCSTFSRCFSSCCFFTSSRLAALPRRSRLVQALQSHFGLWHARCSSGLMQPRARHGSGGTRLCARHGAPLGSSHPSPWQRTSAAKTHTRVSVVGGENGAGAGAGQCTIARL
eukprot:scaffold108529_cov46-Phaeocystis_antarctica.AAC.2